MARLLMLLPVQTAALLCGLAIGSAAAQDEVDKPLAYWLKQLKSEHFAERQKAVRELDLRVSKRSLKAAEQEAVAER